MSAPFRESDDPTHAALARLDAQRTHPIRTLAMLHAWYRPVARAGVRPKLVEDVTALGFRLLGCAAEGLLPTYRKQIFVDRPRTTQAHLSTRGYFFITYFESGHCIITWDHVPQTPSSEVLESRATSGSLGADYEAHVAAVKGRASSDRCIVVGDLPTAVQLGRLYYKLIAPIGLVTISLLTLPLLVIGVLFVALMLVRGLR